MEEEEYKDLVEKLSNEFVLIRKSRFYNFIGGFVAVLLAAGFITFSVFKDTVIDVRNTFNMAAILQHGGLEKTEDGIKLGKSLIVEGGLSADALTSRSRFENQGAHTVLSGASNKGMHHLLVGESSTPISVGEGFLHIGSSGQRTALWVSGNEIKVGEKVVYKE